MKCIDVAGRGYVKKIFIYVNLEDDMTSKIYCMCDTEFIGLYC